MASSGKGPFVIRGATKRSPLGRGRFRTTYAYADYDYPGVDIIIDIPLYGKPRQWVNWTGHQQGPVGPNNVAAVDQIYPQTDLPPRARSRISYEGWAQQPLSADNVVSFSEAWVDNPVPKSNRRYSYEGQQSPSVVPDNYLSFSSQWDDLPYPPGKRWLRYSFDGFLQSPLAADNYVSMSRQWDAVPVPRANRRYTYEGAQRSPTPLDFFEPDQEAIHRRETDVPEPGKTRYRKYSFDGLTLSPTPADNYESFKRVWDELPPAGKRFLKHSFDGFSQQPLAADNYESFARIETTVPARSNPRRLPWDGFQLGLAGTEQDFLSAPILDVPRPRNPRRVPWDGMQAGPLAADAQIDVPLPTPVYPDVMPRYRFSPRVYPIFDGFIAMPTPADVIFVPSGGVYIPNIRPRRR